MQSVYKKIIKVTTLITVGHKGKNKFFLHVQNYLLDEPQLKLIFISHVYHVFDNLLKLTLFYLQKRALSV